MNDPQAEGHMASYIERRKFLATLGGAAAARPLTARAQQPAKVPTIGFLGSSSPASQGQWLAACLQRLREPGWIEGRNLTIEYRWAGGRSDRAAELAGGLKVDIILTYVFRASLPDETGGRVARGWPATEWPPKVAGGGERTDRDAMRVQMLLGPDTPHTIIRRNDLEPPQAMIAVRGMEGARDETVMFLRHRARWDGTRRVYLFKSGGGAAAPPLDPPARPAPPCPA